MENPDRLPRARLVETVPAPRTGYLAAADAREIGLASVDLGAGRARKGDPIDHAVGFVIHHKVGDRVKEGEPLFTIHANDEAKLAAARERVLAAHRIGRQKVEPLPL